MSGKSSEFERSGIDRRVQRTRAALQRALLELLQRKAYERITVEDICASANVGRSTFYGHYRTKDELKRGAIDDHLAAELAERRRTAGTASPTLTILEHVREHRHSHRSLTSRGASVAIDAIRRSLGEILRKEQGIARHESPFEREFRVQYLVGAFMSVLLWWLERGAREEPKQIDALFREMSIATLQA